MLLISLMSNTIVFAEDSGSYSKEKNSIRTIRDDEKERVVIGVENGFKFVATLNKSSNTLELVKIDAECRIAEDNYMEVYNKGVPF